MGSIYKRVRKRPIPKNAEIITQRGKAMVLWGGKNNRKRKSLLTEDGRHMLVEAQTYYMKYTNENGLEQIENTRMPDQQTARQVLYDHEKRVAEIKAGIINPVEERLRKAAKMQLAQHVKDFKKFMQDKGGDSQHVEQTINYINRLIELSEATHYSHLTAEGVLGALRHLQTEKIKGRRGHKNRSPRTANAHLVAIKSFCRWMVRTKRVKSNPVETLEKFPETTDRRHERRAMSTDEFIKLIETADASPGKAEGVDGPTRATIYLIAAMTGLRRKELASLTLDDFRLDALTPTVRIQGAYSKNKRTDEIPLHPDELTADTAYGSDENQQRSEEAGVELVSPVPGKRPEDADGVNSADFEIGEDGEVLSCPMCQPPIMSTTGKTSDGVTLAIMNESICCECLHRENCPAKQDGKGRRSAEFTDKQRRLATRRRNENTNGLLRQYFPKGMDFSKITTRQLKQVETELNNRPRKTLNYRTPSEVMQE